MKEVLNLIYISCFMVYMIGDSQSLGEHLKIQVSSSPFSSELLQLLQQLPLPTAPSLSVKTLEQ